MALVDRKVLVHYAVAVPRLSHEGHVLAHVAGDIHMGSRTRQGCVSGGIRPSEHRHPKVRPLNGAVPAGVKAAEIYGLPAWTPAATDGASCSSSGGSCCRCGCSRLG